MLNETVLLQKIKRYAFTGLFSQRFDVFRDDIDFQINDVARLFSGR